MRIPFGLQSYEHEARQLSAQRMVNCFLEKQPAGAKSPVAVMRTPGIREIIELPTSPVRGMTRHQGSLYAVSGNYLYLIQGMAYETIGDVPNLDRVVMLTNGSDLGVLTGTDLYVYDGAALAQVTDGDFGSLGAIDGVQSDLFSIFAKPHSDQFFISDAAASPFPDMKEYNALDFGQAEAVPGDIVAVEADHRELLVFKEDATEIWTNTNNADFPFQPIRNAFMEVGCLARDSIAKADNTVFWLANDMTVRRAEGYTPVRISTHAIEAAITQLTGRSAAIAFAHPHNGHLFYVLSFPADDTTFVYDITTGLWHERETDEASWRAGFAVFANDAYYTGDLLSGKIGVFSESVYTDFGDPHRVLMTSPSINSEGRELFFGRLHVDFEMGRGAVTGQGADPQAMLQWSDDGGRTWSSEYWRSIGKIGEYRRRAVWNRLGSSPDRVFRLGFSDPVPFTQIAAFAEVEVGST